MKKKLPVTEAVAACGATLEECSTAMRRIGEAINPKNMKKSKVKLIPVDQLELNEGQLDWLPRNPRQWTQTDIDRMRASLAEDPDFPEERPVLAVPGPDGRLVVFAHNLLTKVAKLDGSPEQLPTVVHYPVSGEDQEAIRRRALKDNGQFGSWDTEILADEWADYEPEVLEEMGIPDWVTGGAGKAETGSGGGSGAGDGSRTSGKSAKEDEDFDPNKGILVRCKPGDIWELGDHRLMCGDSTDLETVKSLMGGGLADMVFTDPPYGVAIGDKNKTLQSVQPSGRIEDNIANDTLAPDELYQVLKPAFDNLRQSCKEDATYFVCAPPGGDVGLMMMMMMADAGLRPRHQIVWNKSAATFSLGRL
ncbi:MAG: hypothetical protein SPK87_09170, partial [Bacteroidales bacterium]|nr:hypothetical protein [Bacteroidales bacterium]